MSDIFDLLGDAASKKPNNDDDNTQDDGLDFLGGFKKKVTSGELRPKGNDGDDAAGLPLDIADLPDPQRQVMFMMLRDSKAKTKGLNFDEIADRVDIADLENTLNTLVTNNWLIIRGDAYRVVFKRKKGRLDNLWSALED